MILAAPVASDDILRVVAGLIGHFDEDVLELARRVDVDVVYRIHNNTVNGRKGKSEYSKRKQNRTATDRSRGDLRYRRNDLIETRRRLWASVEAFIYEQQESVTSTC